jgi:3-oxoadipate enol-lactonase
MAYTKNQDPQIYYEFSPVPGKPVLMLANSLGTNLSMWKGQVEEFSRHFSLLRYDARGHGRSSVTDGPYTISQMGTDAADLLDELGLERVHFCGLSMGGMVGLWLGAHAAWRIDRLVVANTAAKIGTAEGWNERIEVVRREGMGAIVPAVLERWFTEGFRANGTGAVRDTTAMLMATPVDGYVASCAAVRDMDLRGDLGRIMASTLVVFGTEDHVTTPEDSEVLVQGIGAAKVLELRAAHLSNVEARVGFTAGVIEFLTSEQERYV